MFDKLKVGAAALALAMAAGTVEAIPYASMIRVSTTTFSGPLTINYRLNEPADSVTVEIINASNMAVASFTAPAARGANQVVWDGTLNNAGGTPIGGGSYRVRITATKNAAAWAEVSGNMSVADFAPNPPVYNTLFDGYSPQDHIFVTDTDSDNFGLGISISSWHLPVNWAGIRLYSDLSTIAGDGYDDRILRATPLEAKAGASDVDAYDLWGAAIDPDGDRVYVTGQDQDVGYRIWQGSLSDPAEIVDADPPGLYTLFPREIVISQEGSEKYAYITQAASITKTAITTATGEFSAAPVTITAFTGSRYSKGIALDSQGNLYYTSAGNTNADRTGGILLRWDAAQVAGATPAQPLTEDNATWRVTHSGDLSNMNGVTVTPDGALYVIMVQTNPGIYLVGNTSQATLNKELGLADRVVDLSGTGELNFVSAALDADPVGNIAVYDRNLEQIRLYAPAGNHSTPIVAPTSQTITVESSSVDAWSLY